MSAPIYCRTTGSKAAGCACFRCNPPAPAGRAVTP